MSLPRAEQQLWGTAAVLVIALLALGWSAESREVAAMEMEVPPDAPFVDPESLADLVRYTEPVELEGRVQVAVRVRAAHVVVSLVDSEHRVRELAEWVEGAATFRFASVAPDDYRVRIAARGPTDAGTLRARVIRGGLAPGLLGLAILVVILPPLAWTSRRKFR